MSAPALGWQMASLEVLRSILEHLPLSAAAFDVDLHYLAVSRRWREEHGLGREELVGRQPCDVSPRIRTPFDWQAVQHLAREGAVQRSIEERFVRADGSEARLHWDVGPWHDAGGRIGGIVVVCEEISARAISAPRGHEGGVESLLAASPLGICAWRGPELIYELVNPAYQRFAPGKEFIGKRYAEVWPEAPEPFVSRLLEVMRTGEPLVMHEVAASIRRTPQGPLEQGLWDVSCAALPADAAGHAGVVCMAIETTAQARAAAALRAGEKQLQAEIAATRALTDLSMTAARENDLDVLLTAVLDAAIAITGADFGSIQLVDPATGDLVIAAARGFPSWWIACWNNLAEGEGACGAALQRGERVIVEDIERSSIYAGTPALAVELRAGVRAVQSTPLINRAGRAIGMFSTHYRRVYQPDEHTLRMVDLLARQASDLIERVRTDDALRFERDKLQALVDNVSVGVVVANPRFEILAMNPEALRIHGFASQEQAFAQLDRYAEEFILCRPGGEPLPFEQWPAMRSLQGESCFDEELVLVRRRDGQRLSVRYRVVPITAGGGEVILYLANVLDLSDIRLAERAMEASEERLTQALAAANAGSWDWDLRSGAVVWSEMHYRLLGYPVGGLEPSVEAWRERVHPEDLPEVEARLNACIEQWAADFSAEYRVIWPDGSVHWIHARGKVYSDADGPSRMYGVVTDISSRKHDELELRHVRDELEQRVHERTVELRRRGDQLARLAAELVLTEQRERRQLARLLHDGLQQLLVSARYSLDAVLPRLASDVRPMVQRASAALDESIKASRELTIELSPPVLHESGLAAGLQWLARWMGEKHGLAVQLQLAADDFGEHEETRLLLFESAREVLFNVVKHSGVREARLAVSQEDGGHLRVTVSDDGRGFDTAVLRPATDLLTGCFGLFSIRERLHFLGGRLHIESAPGGGTRVIMEAPSTADAALASTLPVG